MKPQRRGSVALVGGRAGARRRPALGARGVRASSRSPGVLRRAPAPGPARPGLPAASSLAVPPAQRPRSPGRARERTAAGWAAALRKAERTLGGRCACRRTRPYARHRDRTLLARSTSTRSRYLSEIFNRRSGRSSSSACAPTAPGRSARVGPDGTILSEGRRCARRGGRRRQALGVAGTRLAEGSSVRLVLTRVDGRVRLEGDGWRRELARRVRLTQEDGEEGVRPGRLLRERSWRERLSAARSRAPAACCRRRGSGGRTRTSATRRPRRARPRRARSGRRSGCTRPGRRCSSRRSRSAPSGPEEPRIFTGFVIGIAVDPHAPPAGAAGHLEDGDAAGLADLRRPARGRAAAGSGRRG